MSPKNLKFVEKKKDVFADDEDDERLPACVIAQVFDEKFVKILEDDAYCCC
jgi:hypothetical protein